MKTRDGGVFFAVTFKPKTEVVHDHEVEFVFLLLIVGGALDLDLFPEFLTHTHYRMFFTDVGFQENPQIAAPLQEDSISSFMLTTS